VVTIAVSVLLVGAVGGVISPAHAAAEQVLILGSSVTGGESSVEAAEVTAQGLTPVVVDDATWESMAPSQFATYRAIVIGDPTCSETPPAVAVSTASVWGHVVSGNTIIIGTDPVFHGKTQFVNQAIDFVLAGKSGTTGAYLDLSCNYDNQPTTTDATMLDGIRGVGAFTVHTASCYNTAHIVATHPAFAGLTDDYMSGWSCSVHEVLDSWPGDFQVLAIAKDLNSTYTASDGTVGAPYVLASGSGLHSFPLSIDPLTQNQTVGAAATVTARLLDASTGLPVAGTAISLRVEDGPNTGIVGTCSSSGCLTDSNGEVKWSYDGDTTGTDTVQAWLDQNGDHVPSVGEPQTTAAVTWSTPPVTPPNLSNGDRKITGRANEPSLVVDPKNSRHAVVGYNTSAPGCGYASTFDGGKTWSASKSLGAVGGQDGRGDPSLAYAPNGNIYYTCITMKKHWFGLAPTDFGLGVYVSHDGGKTFTGVTIADHGTFVGDPKESDSFGFFDDQETLAIGPDGHAHICFASYNTNSKQQTVEVLDGLDTAGKQWSSPRVVAGPAGDDQRGCGIAVTGTGRVWVSWWDKTTSKAMVAYREPGTIRFTGAASIGSKDVDEDGRQVRLAADPRPGATGVIAIWPTTMSGNTVALLSYTTATTWYGDCGSTDTSPCVASDTGTGIAEPAVSWGADGRILIGYYRAGSAANTVAYRVGRAEGLNLPFGFRDATSSTSDATKIDPFGRFGDYTAVAEASNGSAYAAWTDTRSGGQEVWGAS
jgi:hypothetical protein